MWNKLKNYIEYLVSSNNFFKDTDWLLFLKKDESVNAHFGEQKDTLTTNTKSSCLVGHMRPAYWIVSLYTIKWTAKFHHNTGRKTFPEMYVLHMWIYINILFKELKNITATILITENKNSTKQLDNMSTLKHSLLVLQQL
jgi:hypothetical protein